MNKVFVIGAGIANPDTQQMQMLPEIRKATRNMIMALTATKEALLALEAKRADISSDSLGLVLGSSQGELDVTKQFLKTWSDSKLARPLLFQNSLHNSTTGFLTQSEKLTGPMLTVSNLFFTGEDTLDCARMLIASGTCRLCLATAIDLKVQALMPDGEKPLYKHVQWGEGSASVLLCDQEWAQTIPPLAELIDVHYDRTSCEPLTIKNFYESDAIERFVKELRQIPAVRSRLRLNKPDGSFSEITWKR